MSTRYTTMDSLFGIDRRSFLRGGVTAVVGGAVLGVGACTDDTTPTKASENSEVETNLADFMQVAKGPQAIPGPFPGRVVQVTSAAAIDEADVIAGDVVAQMFTAGIEKLTEGTAAAACQRFFTTDDVIGLKVNPVGAPRISTHLELVEAVVKWLVDGGVAKGNIVIWDRFDTMLQDAGYTEANFPGVRIEAMQTMDENGDSWRGEDGRHVSEDNFDRDAYYFAKGIVGKGVRGYVDDEFYLNQHVFNGEYSYFGKLVTQQLTKIVNIPAFKNTGNGISVATKNLGYGAIANCGRLHQPLFFRVCTHVLAAPWIRDKLVLNVTDGLRGQYDGGPGLNDAFVYPNKSLYFATDPFAMDMVCHQQIVTKRKEMQVKTDEHPRYTQYLFEAQELGLGIVDPQRLEHLTVVV